MKFSLSHPLHAMFYSLTLSKADTFGTGPIRGDLTSSSHNAPFSFSLEMEPDSRIPETFAGGIRNQPLLAGNQISDK